MIEGEQAGSGEESEEPVVERRLSSRRRFWSGLSDEQRLSSIFVYEASSVGITISATFIGALLGVNIDASQDTVLQLTPTFWFILGGLSFGLILSVFLKVLMKMKLQQNPRH